MLDGKSTRRSSGLTLSADGKPGPVGVHPRFVSRIQAVLQEKEETAQVLLTKTYCLLRKVANQLHTHEEDFGRLQYKRIADKCELLCRASRGAATNDRPRLSEVLSLRDEISDLRKTIAAAAPGIGQNAAGRSVGLPALPADIAGGAEAVGKVSSRPSGEVDRWPKRKLTARCETAPQRTPLTAPDQRRFRSHLS